MQAKKSCKEFVNYITFVLLVATVIACFSHVLFKREQAGEIGVQGFYPAVYAI